MLCVDLYGFFSPYIITGDQLRPDVLLSIDKTTLYVTELSIGFETNLLNFNAKRKHGKYRQLTRDLSSNYISHHSYYISLTRFPPPALLGLPFWSFCCWPFFPECPPLKKNCLDTSPILYIRPWALYLKFSNWDIQLTFCRVFLQPAKLLFTFLES